jgi:hypothetical protein
MKKFRGMMYFLAGVVFTVAVMFSFFSTQDAGASGNCIRTALMADSAVGDVPDIVIKLGYQIPSCLKAAGYTVHEVKKYNGGVKVIYKRN